jgi:hypothetical protein
MSWLKNQKNLIEKELEKMMSMRTVGQMTHDPADDAISGAIILRELDEPTRDILRGRVNQINTLCLAMHIQASQCGLQIRFPNPIRVCHGVTWSGTWNGGEYGLELKADLQSVTCKIAAHTTTPKARAKALAVLRSIEAWVHNRLGGIKRHADGMRKAQVKWENQLKSEIAMRNLSQQDSPSKHIDINVAPAGKLQWPVTTGGANGGGGEFPF